MPTINNLNVKGPLNAGVDQLIERWVATDAATSKTFSNLHGDTDLEYYIRARIVNGYNGAINIQSRLNNDSGNNYGFQNFSGADTATAAARDTSEAQLYLSNTSAQNEIMVFEYTINAKSGVVRTIIGTSIDDISTTTVTKAWCFGQVWNNTADEITSIVFLSNQTNGIGAGSEISLWCRRGVAS